MSEITEVKDIAAATIEDDPEEYLRSLTLEVMFDPDEDNLHLSCGDITEIVFGAIEPADYGTVLYGLVRDIVHGVIHDVQHSNDLAVQIRAIAEPAGDDPDCEMDIDTAIAAAQAAVIERQLDLLGLRLYGNDNTEPGGTWLIVDQDDHTVAGGSAGLTLSQVEAWIAHHPGYPGVPVAEGTALAKELLRLHKPEILTSP